MAVTVLGAKAADGSTIPTTFSNQPAIASNDVNPPTSAKAARFDAIPTTQGVRVTWRTAQETRIAGFNLYRSSGAASTRLNAHLIAAKHGGSVLGAPYRFLDSTAHPGRRYTYRLQLVRLDGERVWVGSTTVRVLR